MGRHDLLPACETQGLGLGASPPRAPPLSRFAAGAFVRPYASDSPIAGGAGETAAAQKKPAGPRCLALSPASRSRKQFIVTLSLRGHEPSENVVEKKILFRLFFRHKNLHNNQKIITFVMS